MKLENLIESYDEPEPRLEEGILYEGGLARVWQHTKRPFSIITAFRNNFSLKQNRRRNSELEKFLKPIGAGAIKLTGHWEEAPDGMSWEEAKRLGLTEDVTEDSYFVPMPKDMEFEEFRDFNLKLVKKYNQDAAIIGDGKTVGLLWKDGSFTNLGTPTWDKFGQSYSTIRDKKIPFIFEGTIQPSNNLHKMALKMRGISWFSEVHSKI